MKQREKEIFDGFFAGIPKQGDGLLLVSPLFLTRAPLLNLHLLQAACRREKLLVHVLYSNLLYSVITGQAFHFKMAREDRLFFGERFFTPAAFGFSAGAACKEKFLTPGWLPDHVWKITPDQANQAPEVFAPYREWIGTVDWQHLESRTTQWVQAIARRIANMAYPVVGCSTSPGGLVPSIALLSHIKKAKKDVITILGGALCEEEMAEGIASLNTGIDYVFSGEGELTFPEFIKQVLAGRLPQEKIIYGKPVRDLNTLPLPDYREYFRQLETLPSSNRPSPDFINIPYEMSRGCWHGKCPFCAYNGKTNFYRKKSFDIIRSDLKDLILEHPGFTVFMTDNAVPPDYFTALLPRISKEVSSFNFCCEVKAPLTLTQMRSIKEAGASSIEPGIESLSSSLLKRMRKGVTVRENIAILRYARSIRLTLSWFLLSCLPGDERKEYEDMLRLLPLIHHLPPPHDIIPMMIFRFSLYQKCPGEFAISNLRPADVYNDIFPSHAHREKIAYYFTADFNTQSLENPEIIAALAKEIRAWKEAWTAYKMVPLDIMLPTLHITRKNKDEYVLEDTRGLPGKPERMQKVLNREQAGILLVARPRDSSPDYQWALDDQLGILRESWFIPLATAEPDLLLELEQDYES